MFKSWKTTLFGIVAITVGIWSMHVTYQPQAAWWFNLCYTWCGPLALIITGFGLIHAKDHNK